MTVDHILIGEEKSYEDNSAIRELFLIGSTPWGKVSLVVQHVNYTKKCMPLLC